MLNILLQNSREEFLFYNDKYNTVLIVLAIVLIATFLYLIFNGARLRRLEAKIKEMEQKRQQSDS